MLPREPHRCGKRPSRRPRSRPTEAPRAAPASPRLTTARLQLAPSPSTVLTTAAAKTARLPAAVMAKRPVPVLIEFSRTLSAELNSQEWTRNHGARRAPASAALATVGHEVDRHQPPSSGGARLFQRLVVEGGRKPRGKLFDARRSQLMAARPDARLPQDVRGTGHDGAGRRLEGRCGGHQRDHGSPDGPGG